MSGLDAKVLQSFLQCGGPLLAIASFAAVQHNTRYWGKSGHGVTQIAAGSHADGPETPPGSKFNGGRPPTGPLPAATLVGDSVAKAVPQCRSLRLYSGFRRTCSAADRLVLPMGRRPEVTTGRLGPTGSPGHNRAHGPVARPCEWPGRPFDQETGMPKKNNRRLMMDRLRALPFCLGLWLAPPTLGTPTLGIA
jgi:hypothetical protein